DVFKKEDAAGGFRNAAVLADAFEAAPLGRRRTVDALVDDAKKLQFHVLWRRARAVDADEGRAALGAVRGNRARNHLAAASARAADQHSAASGCGAADEIHHEAHSRRRADDAVGHGFGSGSRRLTRRERRLLAGVREERLEIARGRRPRQYVEDSRAD